MTDDKRGLDIQTVYSSDRRLEYDLATGQNMEVGEPFNNYYVHLFSRVNGEEIASIHVCEQNLSQDTDNKPSGKYVVMIFDANNHCIGAGNELLG
jgi:hypothetical protein